VDKNKSLTLNCKPMKKMFLTFVVILICTTYAFSNTIIVDKNGGGQFVSIQTAIINSTTGDTIKVLPGNYSEQITLNKNVILMGSGYENTIISGPYSPIVKISSGKIMWFMISSSIGRGLELSGGIVVNCVVNGCSDWGVYSNTPNVSNYIANCVIVNCMGGVLVDNNATITAVNCIAKFNSGAGFNSHATYSGSINVNYCCGSIDLWYGQAVGCIDEDPLFNNLQTNDFHISQGSPCWNTGNPALQDPDVSISDMGYFGGPDCPIYPTVYEIIITPNGNNINLEAKGRANY